MSFAFGSTLPRAGRLISRSQSEHCKNLLLHIRRILSLFFLFAGLHLHGQAANSDERGSAIIGEIPRVQSQLLYPPSYDECFQSAKPVLTRKDIYHDGWIDLNKNGKQDIYEDQAQPMDKRVEDLLSQMTL